MLELWNNENKNAYFKIKTKKYTTKAQQITSK